MVVEFFSVFKLLIICGFMLVGTFMVLLAWPQSQLRAVLMPVVGWAVAIFCGLYCISPLDCIPECFVGPLGLVDDFAALVTGIAAAAAAHQASKEGPTAPAA